MNLHEECLLKYLLNPMGPAISTELLKPANECIIKNTTNGKILAKASKVSYITNRY